jgi:hypothetical protein
MIEALKDEKRAEESSTLKEPSSNCGQGAVASGDVWRLDVAGCLKSRWPTEHARTSISSTTPTWRHLFDFDIPALQSYLADEY